MFSRTWVTAMGCSRLAKILNRTADAGFAANREGMIRAWNCSAERLFGYSASEALNMPCAELLSCQTAAHACTACTDRPVPGGVHRSELRRQGESVVRRMDLDQRLDSGLL